MAKIQDPKTLYVDPQNCFLVLSVTPSIVVKHEKTPTIEEGFIKKPRQTVVIAFWGKMATHMLLLRLCSRQIVKRRAGSKFLGGYLYITYFIIDRLVFHQMFCCSLANKMINKINKSVFKLEIQIYIKQQGKVQRCVHNKAHSDQKFPMRHTILPPKQKQRLFAFAFCINPSSTVPTPRTVCLCFLYKSFFYCTYPSDCLPLLSV